MKKENVVILNRWNDQICEYHKFIDHANYNVFYIANNNGMKAIENCSATGVWAVRDLTIEECEPIVSSIIKNNGVVDSIIAFSEVDQELAAYIRERFKISGMGTDKVQRFRNKVVMKQVLQARNILTPVFYDLSDTNDINKMIQEIKFPLIIKPKYGVSSEGVIKIKDLVILNNTLSSLKGSDYECEEFIDGKVFHADGLISGGNLIFFNVSEYINTCLEYTLGSPLGSVMSDDDNHLRKYKEYALSILDALELDNSAFHLEFIIMNNEIYFLEIGARVGGAGVAALINEIYGINLFHCWIDIQLGIDINKHLEKIKSKHVGGWLLFPEPRALPSRVTSRTSLASTTPAVMFEHLPDIGHVFSGNGEYRDTSGTYLLKGDSTAEVKSSIHSIITNFNVTTQPIGV